MTNVHATARYESVAVCEIVPSWGDRGDLGTSTVGITGCGFDVYEKKSYRISIRERNDAEPI